MVGQIEAILFAILTLSIFPSTFAQAQTTETYLTITNFDNEFSIQYPPSWDIVEKTNRFEGVDMYFYSDRSNPSDGYIMAYHDVLSTQMAGTLPDFFPSFLKGALEGMSEEGFRLIEDPRYDKYEFDGYQAASAIAEGKMSGSDLTMLIVVTIIDNNLFSFSFASEPTLFDARLPIAENMIRSVKFMES